MNSNELKSVSSGESIQISNGQKVDLSSNNNVKTSNGNSHNNKSQEATTLPMKRAEVLKWNGWGYLDSRFETMEEDEDSKVHVCFKGDRYGLGNNSLPQFIPTAKKIVGLNISNKISRLEEYGNIPEPKLDKEFLEIVSKNNILFSVDGTERLFRSHGQSCAEMWDVKNGTLERLVDAVIWPTNHEEVLIVIDAAAKHNVVLIPIGGGTCVSAALKCPLEEKRMIASLDTTQMCKLLWLNEDNLTAHFQAGIVGQDLEKKLKGSGYHCGHEPDSIEFSTLGGWVATKASGMKRGVYGNIEDIVIYIKMATAIGTLERNCRVPRISCGPDIHNIMLGSEGTIGVITEVTIKVRPLPELQRYGSIIFPHFEDGVAFMRETAKERCSIASVRLMDNLQLRLGKEVRPQPSYFQTMIEKLKQAYLTNIKGYDLEKVCAATLLFEGSADEVNFNERKIYNIAYKYNGIAGGEDHGRSGYRLTFTIAYIRDFCADYYILGDSFETSVPWDRVLSLCRNVKAKICEEFAKRKFRQYFASCRITQIYDAGACVYFYSAFCHYDVDVANPALEYENVEKIARQEVIINGGSISHHHGVGKLQKQFLEKSISETGMAVLKSIKEKLDPQNIFANGNLMMK